MCINASLIIQRMPCIAMDKTQFDFMIHTKMGS